MKYSADLILRLAIVSGLAMIIGQPTLDIYHSILAHHQGLPDQVSLVILIFCSTGIWLILSSLSLTFWSAIKRRMKSPQVTISHTNLAS